MEAAVGGGLARSLVVFILLQLSHFVLVLLHYTILTHSAALYFILQALVASAQAVARISLFANGLLFVCPNLASSISAVCVINKCILL